MQTTDNNNTSTNNDEELIDTLIAISVVAKKLAQKLRQVNSTKEDNPSE